MNARFHKFDLNWLTATTDESTRTASQETAFERIKMPVPPEFGEAWVDIFYIDAGFTLARGVHALEKAPKGEPIPLLEAHAEYPERSFSSQVVQGGFLSHTESSCGSTPKEFLSGPGRDIFRYQDKWQSRVFAEGGVTTKMTSILLSHSLLESFLGSNAAERLLLKLGLGLATEVVVHPIPSQVTTPLNDAFSDQFLGPTQQLFAQAKALEYLAGLTNFVCNDCSFLYDRRQGERRHRARIQQLHDYLMNLNGQLPTSSELAANFGLSPRQLNNEFAAEYGQSIFAFTSDIRLEQARIALLESSTPLKAIALRLGYSHVNHFITAFKRKFGYSPGKLRNSKSQVDAES